MMPDFDPTTGNLPPGQHPATWEEIVSRFGTGARRRRLLAGLEAGLRTLRTAGCRHAWIDGSFVSDKPEPGDFDCCWDTAGVNFDLLHSDQSVLLDFANRRQAQKNRYGGEFFLADTVADPDSGTVFLDFFQTDKYTGDRKGIVFIDLRPTSPAPSPVSIETKPTETT